MRIYLVIFISQLKFATFDNDSYERFTDRDSSSIQNANFEALNYEIERLLDKCIDYDKLYYLVKWKRYDNEHIVWYSIRVFDDASKLVADYENQLTIQSLIRRTRRQLKFLYHDSQLSSFVMIFSQQHIFSHESDVVDDESIHDSSTLALVRDIQSSRDIRSIERTNRERDRAREKW